MPFEPATGCYVDTHTARGFPLGGIGTGGLGLSADGWFGDLRLTNNWMCPVRDVPGCFHALFVRAGGQAQTVLLRRPPGEGRDYDGVRHVARTVFDGRLPHATLRYEDDLPVDVRLDVFTPLVPHDVRQSTLPCAVFRFTLASTVAAEVAVLFSFENVLGRGGSGNLGVDLGPEHELRGVRPHVVYDTVDGNFQEAVALDGRRGVRFRTTQRHDPRTHRAGVTGELLLLADAPEVTVCDGWDASAARASVLDDFAHDGRLGPGSPGGTRPAGAVAGRTILVPGEPSEIVFTLVWWTPDHVTQPGLADGRADGVRVGHVYERHFPGADAVASHVTAERTRLADESAAANRLLEASSLPGWLVRVIENAADSVLTNTVVPASGRLYTLEGVDWHWPMGGLTGTNDQRLSAHPYTATFFTDLDATELDEFRRLADVRGAIPHGNGNCDLALGTTDVPYGWPMFIKDFLPAKEWTDLTMSFVLQAGRLWRTTGRRELLDRFWPAMVQGMEYLHAIAPHGVPEGGTTYDVWDFPGTFVYSATVYLAALAMMRDVAATADPSLEARFAARQATAAARLDGLWDARGYWRSSETVDTIFTAALAGDWFARWAGLDPVVAPERAASHLRHQHRVLVTEAVRAAAGRFRALPRAEATFDGEPRVPPLGRALPRDEEMTYVWQVLSYQAMEQIYLGQVRAGLETIHRIYDRLWHDGNAWSGGLRGTGESIYMTHPVIWAVLHALTGAALDVPGRTLHLSPRVPDVGPLRCPIFLPPCWAWLDHEPATGRTHLEVLRTFGPPVTIDRVRQRAAGGALRTHDLGPTVLAAGTRIRLEST